ncbi:hypothetical protein [Mesorhizobium sp. RMAD-H1]|uniref:hypothetical protein n=1 Tax=Mesorhizobium sp. RMAD-H1 TaxID=2587065 RepID=UPI00160C7698|nr:hypothetical protein [Mesorhizobium sp. RMAD-H1]MBB2974262.1 short-subunit dehydrogenase [Mesorhizobium sp. RMAD-H1]
MSKTRSITGASSGSCRSMTERPRGRGDRVTITSRNTHAPIFARTQRSPFTLLD